MASAMALEKLRANSPYLPSLEDLTRSRHSGLAMARISSSVFWVMFTEENSGAGGQERGVCHPDARRERVRLARCRAPAADRSSGLDRRPEDRAAFAHLRHHLDVGRLQHGGAARGAAFAALG